MDGRKASGVILIVLGVVIAWHAITILDTWEHRLGEAIGYTNKAPYFEIGIACVAAIGGALLLLKKTN